jgi:hypothetical protein
MRVRDTGTTATPVADQAVDRHAEAAAFVACMRQNGVANFPDPLADGSIAVSPDDGVDVSADGFKNADKACKSLAPGGSQRGGAAGAPSVAPASSAPTKGAPKASSSSAASSGGGDRFAKATAFVACMRSNGVPTFPDPGQDGSLQITPDQVDITTPAFQAAEKACKKLMPPPR